MAPNSLFAKSILIEDGDVITIIPERVTVTVVGQVLQPITVAYNNFLDIEDYISLSGGYTDYADKKNIYIISKDGTSKPFNKKYFQRGEAILPGDTIVIPRDMQKVSTIPLVSLSTRIISDIAFAAASLNSIRN